jgi:hypothetical protein
MIGKLQERLQSTISEHGKLCDRKNKAPREVKNSNARSLLLRDQHDTAVKSKGTCRRNDGREEARCQQRTRFRRDGR